MKRNYHKIIIKIIGILIVFFVIFPPNFLLDKYDFTDCKIGIYDFDGYRIVDFLSEKKEDEFINLLNEVVLYGRGSSLYRSFAGRYRDYSILLKTGETIEIACVGPFLVINEKGYLCYYKVLKRISLLYKMQ